MFLYDFEVSWYDSYYNKLNATLSHNQLIDVANTINLSDSDYKKNPKAMIIKTAKLDVTKDYSEIADYDFTNRARRAARHRGRADKELADTIEVRAIELSNNTIGYFDHHMK